VSIADQLRQLADELDAQTVKAPDVARDRADHAEAEADRPAGVSAAGWDAFLRGDNPTSLDPADATALEAAGLLTPSAPVSAPQAPDATGSTPDAPAADPGAAEPVQAPDSTDTTADQPPSSETSVSGTSVTTADTPSANANPSAAAGAADQGQG
jgi:hypothetical protein